MNAERVVNHDRRRYAPHRQAGVVGQGPDRYRKRAFLVDNAFGLVLREYESPRILAHLVRGPEGEFRRFVGVVGKVGKPTLRHDDAIGRHDVDDSSAKVASVSAGDLDLQDDVRAGVDLRGRRPTQRHTGWVRPRRLVRALDPLAHALVRLRRRNSGRRLVVSWCCSATFRREVQRCGQRRGLCPGHAGPNHPWIRLRCRGRG